MDSDGTNFESLIKDIMENPEKVLEGGDITDEQILELQKRMNPYAHMIGKRNTSEKKRTAVFSHTNLRKEYLLKLVTTGLIGFVFQMLKEWEVPPEFRRWKPARKKKKKKEKEPPKPFKANELIERLEKLLIYAKKAKIVEDKANKAQQGALQADLLASKMSSEDKKNLFLGADKLLAKSKGLQYAITSSLCRLGEDADSRLDAAYEEASKYPGAKKIIGPDPRQGKPKGMLEVPSYVAKNIIDNFLRNWFEYDPTIHVKAAYDKKRVEPELHKENGTVVDMDDPNRIPLELILQTPPKPKNKEDSDHLKTILASQANYNAARAVLRDASLAKSIQVVISNTKLYNYYLTPLRKDGQARHTAKIIPPQDTFHRLKYYMEVNYEELLVAVDTLYHDKPDLDSALAIYTVLEGTDEELKNMFDDYKTKHQDDVMTDLKTSEFNTWTLLAPYKQNRDKITYYNKHTRVLQRIMERYAEDKRIGEDLMKNRIRHAKAKNIQELGPESAGMKDYRSQNMGLQSLGAERVITAQELKRLEKAQGDLMAAKELEAIEEYQRKINNLLEAQELRSLTAPEKEEFQDLQKRIKMAKEMLEVPKGAVQVDYFIHDTRTGGFKKNKFYTKADTPQDIQQRQSAAKKAQKGKELEQQPAESSSQTHSQQNGTEDS